MKLRVYPIILALSLICIGTAKAQECPYRGIKITQNQLSQIIELHGQWLKGGRVDSKKRANLCDTGLATKNLSGAKLSYSSLKGSDLTEADLSRADLSYADLFKTYFFNANLSKSFVMGANLQQATLDGSNLEESNLRNANLTQASLQNVNLSKSILLTANFTNANLAGANLSEADLRFVNLTNANLNGANLTNARLDNANLTGANLAGADITNATFFKTNLSGANYQPQLGALPDLISFQNVENLRDIKLRDVSAGKASLTELRKAYENIGLRSIEREITAVISYAEIEDNLSEGGLSALTASMKYIAFGLTSDFGAASSRPLYILFFAIFVFMIPYRLALSFAGKHNTIQYLEFEEDVDIDSITQDPEKQPEHKTKFLNASTVGLQYSWFKKQLCLCGIALYFSILNAFSIGWYGMNLSAWIRRLQTKEFILKGLGWTRVIAGVQSLFSTYLFILWILIYFGKPFRF